MYTICKRLLSKHLQYLLSISEVQSRLESINIDCKAVIDTRGTKYSYRSHVIPTVASAYFGALATLSPP
jgi:hypothetical protein